MARLLLIVLLVGAALAIAAVLARRRPDAPVRGAWLVPAQLDRSDFPRPEAPWLVAVFTSETCSSCTGTMAKAEVLACADVAVAEVEVGRDAELHSRYGIEAVPLVVVADVDGVVRASFVGPPTATDLWAAVAEAREPGSSPEPLLGREGLSGS